MSGRLRAFEAVYALTQQSERSFDGVHLTAQRGGDVFVERVAATLERDEVEAVRHGHTVIAPIANRLRNSDARNSVAEVTR